MEITVGRKLVESPENGYRQQEEQGLSFDAPLR